MDKSNFKNKLPNILTIFRIILTPIIISFILLNFGNPIYVIKINVNSIITINLSLFLAGILFVLSSFTDFLDGYLARKWNVISTFGKFWDPIADKILVNATLFSLSSIQMLPIWIPICILIRDIIMDGTRMWCSSQKVVIPANIWGKLKTFAMMIGIVYIMFFGVSLNNDYYFWAIQLLLMYVSVLLSYISLVIYNIHVIRKIKDGKNIYS